MGYVEVEAETEQEAINKARLDVYGDEAAQTLEVVDSSTYLDRSVVRVEEIDTV